MMRYRDLPQEIRDRIQNSYGYMREGENPSLKAILGRLRKLERIYIEEGLEESTKRQQETIDMIKDFLDKKLEDIHKPLKGKQYVAYYRVSTKKQGLGLEAQKNAVKSYLKGLYPPQYEYTEKESGKLDKRPELNKALKRCKELKATLIVAKLDRLSRDLHFITSLQKAKIDFVCCDMPQASHLTLHIMGALAQWEREQISKRTSEALTALKEKGVKFGTNDPRVRKGLEKRWAKLKIEREKKKEQRLKEKLLKRKLRRLKLLEKKPSKYDLWFKSSQAVKSIRKLRNQNYSIYQIADQLNKLGIPTRTQRTDWEARQVFRVLDRIRKEEGLDNFPKKKPTGPPKKPCIKKSDMKQVA